MEACTLRDCGPLVPLRMAAMARAVLASRVGRYDCVCLCVICAGLVVVPTVLTLVYKVWFVTFLLYRTLQRRTNARPLLNYGRWALVEDGWQHLFGPALRSRGLQVVVLYEKASEQPKSISVEELPHWLGTQQWHGGVGVLVMSSQNNDMLPLVCQHMAFRASGAIILFQNDSSEILKQQRNGVTLLDIPLYLQTSPSVAEAALEALGDSRRLQLHHVLWQQVKRGVSALVRR